MTITALIADDHRIVRDGLRALLQGENEFEVVAEAENGWDTVEAVKKFAPQVVIMDINMPGLNGVDATRRIQSLGLPTRVLSLSSHGSQEFVKAMLKAGAAGYLLKECASSELFTAIRTVVAGKVYVSPAVAGNLVKDYISHLDGTRENAPELTGREREVLQLLTEGQSTNAIAERLSLSVKTVESHRLRIMNKLDIRTIAGLTKYAIRSGITSLED